MTRELLSDTSRIPITISIRSRRRPSLRVAHSFDRAGRKLAHAGVESVVVLAAICDVLPLMNDTESDIMYYMQQRGQRSPTTVAYFARCMTMTINPILHAHKLEIRPRIIIRVNTKSPAIQC